MGHLETVHVQFYIFLRHRTVFHFHISILFSSLPLRVSLGSTIYSPSPVSAVNVHAVIKLKSKKKINLFEFKQEYSYIVFFIIMFFS
jgi:hypothetical protein